jgi:hypothetical protein
MGYRKYSAYSKRRSYGTKKKRRTTTGKTKTRTKRKSGRSHVSHDGVSERAVAKVLRGMCGPSQKLTVFGHALQHSLLSLLFSPLVAKFERPGASQ